MGTQAASHLARPAARAHTQAGEERLTQRDIGGHDALCGVQRCCIQRLQDEAQQRSERLDGVLRFAARHGEMVPLNEMEWASERASEWRVQAKAWRRGESERGWAVRARVRVRVSVSVRVREYWCVSTVRVGAGARLQARKRNSDGQFSNSTPLSRFLLSSTRAVPRFHAWRGESGDVHEVSSGKTRERGHRLRRYLQCATHGSP